MYFKKISMNGFKSFADPVTIEFGQGITCVVGPNGSGKSNISDALRWVLGEQSPKMLRGGKMDEVIFAGTASRKSRGMAEVTLVIDNSDGSLPVDFSEVAITRRMYRSGESEYYINDSQCRLRDIRELIMDTGIGVDGYSLIGQGKIADIISGKPESRRGIFEEAAGIVKYRNKKAETERKLSAAGSNLDRVNDIISGLEERLGPLKEEAGKAERYLELDAAYRNAEISVILKRIGDADGEREALQSRAAELDRRAEETESGRRLLEEQIRNLQLEAEELDRRDMEERDRMMQRSDEIRRLAESRKLLLERRESLLQNVRNYRGEKDRLLDRQKKEEISGESLRRQSDALKKSGEEAQRGLEEKNALFISESKRLKEMESRGEEGKSSLYEFGVRISSKKAELSGLLNLQDSLRKRKEQLDAGFPDEQRAEAASDSYEEMVRCAQELNSEAEKLARRAEEAETIRKEAERKTEEISRRLEEIRRRKSEEKARRDTLRQLHDSYEGYSSAVRFIMRRSDLSGIYGTVGDLISVPAGYETAVETALGQRMQNIICSDESCAKDAVQLLKKHKAGRLTFLPLSGMRTGQRRHDASLQGEEGFLAEAADCVRTEEKFRRIVEYLLSGVAVIDTLDHAVKFSAKHRNFRCVTLEGESVSPAGAITGGAYRRKESGGILDRKKQLSQAEEALKKLTREEEELAGEMIRQRDAQKEAQEDSERLQEARKNTETRLIEVNREISAAESRLREQQNQRERIRRELDKIRQELSETETAAEKLRHETAQLEQQSAERKKETEEDIAGVEKARRDLEDLGNKITTRKLEIESIRGQISVTENLIQRTEETISSLKEDIGAKETSIRRSEEEARKLAQQAEETERQLREAESRDKSEAETLRQLQRQKSELAARLSQLTGRKEESDRQILELRTKRSEISVRLEGAEDGAKSLKDRLWEEFEISYLEAKEQGVLCVDFDEAVRESKKLKRRLKELGNVNTGSVAEYASVKEKYDFLDGQRRDLTEAISSLNRIIGETDQKIRSDFRKCFDTVSRHFQSVFTELFGGGKARISLVGDDPLEAGIEIAVQPPGKKLQNMNLLSGGEKTMTAMALMFAVLRAKPTPFCILDEVEAALDEANIGRFADYLENFRGIQFVLVTHQKVTMEHADVLYGITMPEKGISTILSLRLKDAEKMADQIEESMH